MGKWLGSNKPPAGADEWIGFLDRGVKLEGTLELAGTFRVDGEVKGTVRCKERLIVGENGLLEGEIEGSLISVSGKIKGTVRATNRVELLPSGVIEGEVHPPCLVIEAGGGLESPCPTKAPANPSAVPQPLGLRVQPTGTSS